MQALSGVSDVLANAQLQLRITVGVFMHQQHRCSVKSFASCSIDEIPKI